MRAAVVSIMDSVEELHILFISVFGHRQLLTAQIRDPAKPLKAQCLAVSVCIVIPDADFFQCNRSRRENFPKIENIHISKIQCPSEGS